MVNRKALKIIKEYLKLLSAEGIDIYSVYLFGSYATGSFNKDSDLDLMLISDDFVESNDKIIGKIWSLTKKISTKIEPFVVGKHRFDTENSPLIEEIKNSGIEIKF